MNIEDLANSPIFKKLVKDAQTEKALEWGFSFAISKPFTLEQLLDPEKLKRIAKVRKERAALRQMFANCFELMEKMEVEMQLYRKTGDMRHFQRYLYFKSRRDRYVASIRKIYLEKRKELERLVREWRRIMND